MSVEGFQWKCVCVAGGQGDAKEERERNENLSVLPEDC